MAKIRGLKDPKNDKFWKGVCNHIVQEFESRTNEDLEFVLASDKLSKFINILQGISQKDAISSLLHQDLKEQFTELLIRHFIRFGQKKAMDKESFQAFPQMMLNMLQIKHVRETPIEAMFETCIQFFFDNEKKMSNKNFMKCVKGFCCYY